MADIRRGGLSRMTKLASLPAGMAGRAVLGVGKRLTGTSADEVNAELLEKAADELFKVLGELKGGAMKVGQALSVMEAAIPPQFADPFREALVKLQSEAPPLPTPKVHRVLDAQLGTKWRERFQSFDDTPSLRPASARCIREYGKTAARWPSRSSTRAPTTPCARISNSFRG